MRLSRPCAVAAVRKSHACAFHVRAGVQSARGVRERAVCEPLRRRNVDSTASLRRVFEALRNVAAAE
eukprot:11221156-Lingulodinium_polyedra.AAC.1